jgi:hypothetical protein
LLRFLRPVWTGERVPGKPVLPHLILNVPAIARRTEDEVARHLGGPDPGIQSTSVGSTKRSYRGGKIEVVYVDGQARWVKLYTMRELPFSKAALAKLGLPLQRPTYDNSPHVLSWHNISHLKEVSLYGGSDGFATSVLVCVQTVHSGSSPHRRFSLPGLRALAQF